MTDRANNEHTIHVRVKKDWTLVMTVDDHAPLTIAARQSDNLNEVKTDIGRLFSRLEPHSAKFACSARAIGGKLGLLLFGRNTDEANANTPVNAIDWALTSLYPGSSHITVLLSVDVRARESLPWEMIVWRFGSAQMSLGIDPRFSFVRVWGTEPDPGAHTVQADPRIYDVTHITSGGPGDHPTAHCLIGDYMDQLLRKNPGKVIRRAGHTSTWKPSDRPADVLHYYGHGDSDTLPWWPDQGVNAQQLLAKVAAPHQVPSLVVLIGCETFGEADGHHHDYENIIRKLVGLGVDAAIGAVGGVSLLGHASHDKFVLSLFHDKLIRTGRTDKALQHVRRVLRCDAAAPSRASIKVRAQARWFELAVMVRGLDALAGLSDVATSISPVLMTGNELLMSVRALCGAEAADRDETERQAAARLALISQLFDTGHSAETIIDSFNDALQ